MISTFLQQKAISHLSQRLISAQFNSCKEKNFSSALREIWSNYSCLTNQNFAFHFNQPKKLLQDNRRTLKVPPFRRREKEKRAKVIKDLQQPNNNKEAYMYDNHE